MADIFISYAREDQTKAKFLAEVFTQQGWSVWWDRSILPGEEFDKVIESQLTSSKCVVVLWSRHSLNSKWVRDEAAMADQYEKLVPARIEEIDLPLGFRRQHTADLSNWENISNLSDLGLLVQGIAIKLGNPQKFVKKTPKAKGKNEGNREYGKSSSELGTDWRVEPLAKDFFSRSMRIHLSGSTHLVEYKFTMWRDYVSVDGIRVAKGNLMGNLIRPDEFSFKIKSKDQTYIGKIEVKVGATGIKSIRLFISNQLIYSD